MVFSRFIIGWYMLYINQEYVSLFAETENFFYLELNFIYKR